MDTHSDSKTCREISARLRRQEPGRFVLSLRSGPHPGVVVLRSMPTHTPDQKIRARCESEYYDDSAHLKSGFLSSSLMIIVGNTAFFFNPGFPPNRFIGLSGTL